MQDSGNLKKESVNSEHSPILDAKIDPPSGLLLNLHKVVA